MKAVFDASVILVLLNQKEGADVAERYLGKAVISAVNLAEVVSKLARNSSEDSIRSPIKTI